MLVAGQFSVDEHGPLQPPLLDARGGSQPAGVQRGHLLKASLFRRLEPSMQSACN